MALPMKISEWAQKQPNKIAIQSEQGMLNYQEFEEKINKTANAFINLGIKQGERVLIQIGNRFEFMYCYFAAMKIGAIIVPINPLYTSSEISHIVSDSQPSIYVCERSISDNVETVMKESRKLLGAFILDEENPNTSFDALIANESGDYDMYEYAEDDVCEILYTSGTTGKPKGAMLTHHGLYSNALTYSEILKATNDDKSLIVVPLYHAAGQTNLMNTMFVSGGSNYLLARFEPEKVLSTLQNEKITFFLGVPTMYTLLLNHPKVETYQFSLRIAITGSAPMPVEVLNRWKQLFNFDLLEGYGLSECSPIVTNHRPESVKKPGSIGYPLPEVNVKVFDEDGEEVPVGEIGEIVVKGPNVMKGYWKRPEENAAVLKDGWFYTGDVGYQDEDGYFFIVDRKKDMINRAGMKISPREIEEVLYTHPQILEASVIGIPDPVMGEELKAYFTLKNPDDTVDIDELREFCKKSLAPYKVPKNFEVMEELPKTLSGKIQKTVLREQLEQ